MSAYDDARCVDCGAWCGPQTIGVPRRRCGPCRLAHRRQADRARTQRKSAELVAVTPRSCVVCSGPIERVPGRWGRDKYCSVDCAHEGRLRWQRHNRGGLKHPERSVRAIMARNVLALSLLHGERISVAAPRGVAASRPVGYAAVGDEIRREERRHRAGVQLGDAVEVARRLVEELDALLMNLRGTGRFDGLAMPRLARAQAVAAELSAVLDASPAKGMVG